jgi:amidase
MGAALIHFQSLAAVSEKIRLQQLSPVEVTSALLDRIAALDQRFGSFVTVVSDRARERAAAAEAEIRGGLWRGPLHGVPIGLKDLCDTTFAPTSAGMPLRRAHIPSQNATVVDRLEDAGAIILGKLTMTEGAFSEHRPEFPLPSNPWNKNYWPGTSSSGSAIATTLGFCYGALGSDTGGSIRYPSACAGITGVKPTWGRVSRFGIAPIAQSMDHIGPMARTAADCAIILAAIAGPDLRDSTALQAPVPDYLAAISAGIQNIRVGFDAHYANATPDVASALEEMQRILRSLGARIVDVTFPPTEEATKAWLAICASEAAAVHDTTFKSHEHEFGTALSDLIKFGGTLSAADLAELLVLRQNFSGSVAAVFQDIDVLLTPVLSRNVPTPKELGAALNDRVWIRRFTTPFNLTGHPSITVPAGIDTAGLPIGLQFVGHHLHEALLLRVAHAFQQRTNWHTRRPIEE